ncbi:MULTISPECIES: DNA topology modulation protein [unclassified Bacillus (in: firmicutes)]|uniref:DNA topology modulation protein n=1 Tax=unclassified Bacillus (in: firmicutes) TaxID=185979 RepID=UPI001BEBDCBE|nr:MULTISPECIES: DNA topology modulation protein [unclassified Bacillus (in: firmicutes)]MBT2638920.1 DNA topology modulation protein [Bacillus sp. ISL-39]MBT2659930.1 DNA topology modulation protein [Bacillus sp. ISL-45]
MEKVIIIGCGGAGKSTLSRKLGEIRNIKVYHLDALYWKPGWEMTAKNEWETLIKQVIEKDSWIMDGNYGSTIDMRAQAADTIIFLDYSAPRCLYGVFKRRIMYHGRTRPDMNEGCPERLDWDFIKWVAKYKREKAPGIIAKLEEFKLQGKEIYHFTNPRETNKFIEEQSIKGGR